MKLGKEARLEIRTVGNKDVTIIQFRDEDV